MRISDGSGLDGVSGAAGPEPAFDGDGDSRLYANNTPASQAYFNDDAPPSFERVHEMVDRAVERVKKHLKWEGPAQPPWYPPPGHDNFRREYRHLLWDVQDPAHRAYIKKRFIRLWRYLQDRYHHKKRGGYPDKLRDAYFEQGEVRADLHHIGWGNASARPWAYPPLRIEVKEYLDKHRGTDQWCAFFTSDPHQVASLVPHVDDEDFPPDLLPIMKKYAVLAARDPAAIVDFWTATEHRNIHDRIWEPVLREAQAKVDALNAGALAPEEPTRRLVEEEPAIVEEETPSDVVKAAPDDDVSSDWKLRIGITNQLGAYVLRYPAAIARLEANGFRPEYFGCDQEFFRHLFEITRLPADQWNRGLAELQRKYPAEHSRYLRLGEHLPALSSDELAEYFIPLAGIIQPNPAPVEIDIEPINSNTILEQEPPAAPLQSSPIEIDEQSPAALPAIVEQPPPEPTVEERPPALQRDFVGHTVTPEDRLIGLIVKHRIPAADVQLRPAHFRDHDLQYTWKRWERLGSEVDQFNEDAIRARTRHAWSVFTIWLIDVAAAHDPDNPIDPRAEIAMLAEQIRRPNEEPRPPLAATDVVEILPPVPPAAPLEIVEEAPPESPTPAAPTSPAPAGVIIEEEAPPPTQPVVKTEEQRSVPYVSSARMAEIEAANLEAMLKLAGAGIPAFPARLDWNAEAKKWDKQPAIKGWKKAATTDPEIIRRWWRDLPRKLGLPAYRLVPGIWCGHPALDWIAVDVDRHGGPDGVSAFDALVAEPGNELPVGPRTITAGNGVHHVFRQPSGKTKLGNSKGELPGGIDVRGADGWIVGPGAMRPDGKMWRTADSTPSLIETYRNGTIPVIPPWLADLIRAPKPRKERTPKNKTEAKEGKPSPSTASIPSDKTGTKREKAWARGALNKIVEKLAAMPPNSGRNEAMYRHAFVMGTMVVRGWIDRRTVESEMYSACERNGLVADGDDVRGAIERGLNDSSGCPHDDLPDRRTKAARQQRDSTKAWKNLLPIEIYRLLRVRPGGEFATDDAAKDVLAAIQRDGHVIEKLDRLQFGDLLGATFEEWKAIGAIFGRHPSRFLPCDATPEQVKEHLVAVQKAKNPDRAKAARERRAHEKLKREHQPPTNDLVAQRYAALVAFAKKHPGKHRTGDLVRGLKRWDAFEGITDKTRRNVIDDLLKLAVSGKLPALTNFLIVTKQTATNRKPTFTIEYRK